MASKTLKKSVMQFVPDLTQWLDGQKRLRPNAVQQMLKGIKPTPDPEIHDLVIAAARMRPNTYYTREFITAFYAGVQGAPYNVNLYMAGPEVLVPVKKTDSRKHLTIAVYGADYWRNRSQAGLAMLQEYAPVVSLDTQTRAQGFMAQLRQGHLVLRDNDQIDQLIVSVRQYVTGQLVEHPVRIKRLAS